MKNNSEQQNTHQNGLQNVEQILEKQIFGKVLKYRVKFWGQPETENNWLTEKSIEKYKDMVIEFNKNQEKTKTEKDNNQGSFNANDVVEQIVQAKMNENGFKFIKGLLDCEIEWKMVDGKKPSNSFATNKTIRQYDPVKLVEFYERKILYSHKNDAKQ